MIQQDDFFKDVKPLFILGVPRSGTTFLQQIVNSHPEILITDELRVVSWMMQEAKKISEGFSVHGNPYPFNHGEEFSNYLTGNCGTLIAPFYYQQANKVGKEKLKYWGDKYPHYHEVLHQMAKSFPRASYILIHRDLRDVICSVKNGHKWSIEKSSQYVCNIYKQYIKTFKELLEQKKINYSQIINVDYLLLSLNIEEETEKIFNALGLDFIDSCRKKVLELRNIQSHSIRKTGEKIMEFNIDNSSGRWKSELSEIELKIVLSEIDKISSIIEDAKSLQTLLNCT
jgi:hypothetical protein